MRKAVSEGEFVELLGSVERYAHRWEHQPHYDEPGEREQFDAFRAGSPIHPPADLPWVAMVRGLVASGRELVRVRVQEEPPTEYQRWLHWSAEVWNVPVAGERIRVMPRSRARCLEPLMSDRLTDWWLLDGRQLVLLTFDRRGRRLTTELCDDRLPVLRARAWWGLALQHSTPVPPQGVLTNS